MRRTIAHNSKIPGALDEPAPKYFLPHAIHRHPRHQRLRGREQPLSEPAAVPWRAGRQVAHKMGHRRLHPLEAGEVVAALQDIRKGRRRLLDRDQGRRTVLGEGVKRLVVRRDRCGQGDRLRILFPEEKTIGDDKLFLRRPLRRIRLARHDLTRHILIGEARDFRGRQRAFVETHVLKASFAHGIVVVAAAEVHGGIRANGILRSHRIEFNLSLRQFSVEINFHPRAFARAVVGDKEVHPFVARKLAELGRDLNAALGGSGRDGPGIGACLALFSRPRGRHRRGHFRNHLRRRRRRGRGGEAHDDLQGLLRDVPTRTTAAFFIAHFGQQRAIARAGARTAAGLRAEEQPAPGGKLITRLDIAVIAQIYPR